MNESTNLIPMERIERSILLIRGEKVMLDIDLAAIYGVTTKRLNEQVKRNLNRFPSDFMFQLTETEKTEVVANCDHLVRLKFSPYSHRLPFSPRCVQSARGLAHSKTLREFRASSSNAPASWTAVALHRFSFSNKACLCAMHHSDLTPALFHRNKTATGGNLDFIRSEPGVGGIFPPEPRGDHGIARLHQRSGFLVPHFSQRGDKPIQIRFFFVLVFIVSVVVVWRVGFQVVGRDCRRLARTKNAQEEKEFFVR
jgi:hypothetical protein